MLDSIFIKNYKNLNGLTIQNLEKVNLITGKINFSRSGSPVCVQSLAHGFERNPG